ncbi:MAG: leucyl aminopeptidase [Alphaproteobacteria bacterium]|nr:leucyl aminopeptidase [Alphaproteobacteria bacterium]
MKVTFSTAKPADVACDALVVIVGDAWREELAGLDAAMGGGLVGWLEAEDFDSSARSVPTFGRIAPRNLLLVPCGEKGLAMAFAKAGRTARASGYETVALLGLPTDDAGALLEQFRAGSYAWEAYKAEKDRTPPVDGLIVLGAEASPGLDGAAAEADVRSRWQDWSRDLVNAPPADLYPETLAQKAYEALSGIDGVSVDVWDLDRCKDEGLVGLVAVGQGSTRPGCLIHVAYRPANATRHIAFVGKGVTFDSGGLSLKPSAAMQTMRCDMGGAAVVLGAIGALAELGVPVSVDCFVGAVENMNDGNSYKLGDILRYRNGVTVEIHNTDAEGRLVLADCLINACAVEGVDTVIDAATLTGACVIALGEDFTGMFTHDDALARELQEASDACGDGLWRLPLHNPYSEKLKGKWSQIKNVGGRDAGATTAALFLQHFVTEDVRWCHLDVAGSSWRDSATKAWAPGGTGQMVRSLATWVASLA